MVRISLEQVMARSSLSPKHRVVLERIRATTRRADVYRDLSIILLTAAGHTRPRRVQQLGCPPAAIDRVRHQFRRYGPDGLIPKSLEEDLPAVTGSRGRMPAVSVIDAPTAPVVTPDLDTPPATATSAVEPPEETRTLAARVTIARDLLPDSAAPAPPPTPGLSPEPAVADTPTPVPKGPRGYCLAIGLNGVDRGSPAYMHVEVPPLRGCVYDAQAIAALVGSLSAHEATTVLTDVGPQKPTRERVLAALRDAADRLQPGDFFLVHFSGHGMRGSVRNGLLDPHDPDIPSWVLHDGPLARDELYLAWFRFRPRVRILVLVDSGHGEPGRVPVAGHAPVAPPLAERGLCAAGGNSRRTA